MPINPQIVTAQLPGIQIENPMTFARNALAMKQAQSEIAANELAAREAQGFNQLVSASRQPGGVALTPDVLMQAGLFKKAKELQEVQNAMTTGQKEENALVGAEMDLSRRMLEGISALPPDQKANAYVQWHEMQHANPVLQRYFKRIGLDKSQADARIQAALQQPGGLDQLIAQSALGLEKAMARNFVTMDLGGTKEVISMPSLYPGRAETVPGSSRTVTASPNRPIYNLGPAETERSKTLGKGGAEADIAEYNTVRSAARSINKDYETIKLLQEGKPSTGITAELELGFNRLKAAAGGKPDAIEKVADTEYLEALLGSDVFNQFQALGVGARGLDTRAEREFLQQVISGTRTLDKETLIRMAEMRAKYKRSIVEEFNERVESGELDDFFKDYGRTKRLFALPKPPEVTVTGPGGKPLGSQGVSVDIPGRGTVVFPNKEAADAFKAAAGIK